MPVNRPAAPTAPTVTSRRPTPRSGRGPALVGAFLALLTLVSPLGAQSPDAVRVEDGETGRVLEAEIGRHRGYATVPVRALELAGWRGSERDGRWTGRAGSARRLELEAGVPIARLDGFPIQLTDPPYLFGEEFWVPVHLLVDVLPDRAPGLWSSGGEGRLLRVVEPGLWGAGTEVEIVAPAYDSGAVGEPPVRPEPGDPTRVVVIDPGHGGDDPGALGPRGEREKDIALAVARALRDALAPVPDLEVHLTRETDILVPLWRRGTIATEIKGDRPGVFVSIHVNALGNREVRGFETYFLSEARTEHEERVAALENSAVQLERPDGTDLSADPELGFILNELRNFDHQHWSADLAAVVQRRMATVHPGPNRGVKQGPFAVITNALMPSVLVELGFVSNPAEARTLTDPEFHREVGRTLAEAIEEFFERYPPGRGTGDGGER